MNFHKLKKNKGGSPIWVNFDQVVAFTGANKDTDTALHFATLKPDGTRLKLIVQETPSTITKLLKIK